MVGVGVAGAELHGSKCFPWAGPSSLALWAQDIFQVTRGFLTGRHVTQWQRPGSGEGQGAGSETALPTTCWGI